MKKAIFNAHLIVLVRASANDDQALEIFTHTLTDKGYTLEGELGVNEKIVSFEGEIHQQNVVPNEILGHTARIIAANKIKRCYSTNTDLFEVQTAEVSFSCYEETGNISDIPGIAPEIPVVDPANAASVVDFVEKLGQSFTQGIEAALPKPMPEYPPAIVGTPGELQEASLEIQRVLSETEPTKPEPEVFAEPLPEASSIDLAQEQPVYRSVQETPVESPQTDTISDDRGVSKAPSPSDLSE